MSKYTTLVGILDQICEEAPASYKFYHPKLKDVDQVNAARARAYIHLFLKVKAGLLGFVEREKCITDGVDDGGIDGYYIDQDLHMIYLIQSKFRTTSKNFEEKEISLDELLSMEVKQIVNGKKTYNNGNAFNAKILAMQRGISGIKDIGRYEYKVILLANLNSRKVTPPKLRTLVDGYDVETYNNDRAYTDLVFPVVAGTYYKAPDLHIKINLVNAAAGSARVRYFVSTHFGKCEITLLFVPTYEIGRILYKYRNSILTFNPRSYLGLSKNRVNREIRSTIVSRKTNEFALFNNGITLLGDSAQFNESTGQEGVAQVVVTNPQIINGGQTAYTLNQIFEDVEAGKLSNSVFDGKEVLLKIISTNSENVSSDRVEKLRELIEQVSRATNSQTKVEDADRRSNDKIQIELQKAFFDRYGLYYERKLGEFHDGVKDGYITEDLIVRRDTLVRVSLACDSKAAQARSGIAKFFSEESFNRGLLKTSSIDKYVYGLTCLKALDGFEGKGKDKYRVGRFGQALRYGRLAVVSVLVNNSEVTNDNSKIHGKIEAILGRWSKFESYARRLRGNAEYFGGESEEANYPSYYKGSTLDGNLEKFFKL